MTAQFSALTATGTRRPGRTRPFASALSGRGNNLIDQYILADLQANNVTPADKTNDWEFIRRVTLDLTGRIPTTSRVVAFVTSNDANKRAELVDELLAAGGGSTSGPCISATSSRTRPRRCRCKSARVEGRNAFYKWIHDSLASHKPYNQMATELISAQGNNNFDQPNGQLNYLVLGSS